MHNLVFMIQKLRVKKFEHRQGFLGFIERIQGVHELKRKNVIFTK